MKTMPEWGRDFTELEALALTRCGGAEALAARLPMQRTAQEIADLDDRFLLSALCRRVFRAGLKHSVVDARWPVFEEVFKGFEPLAVASMSDEQLQATLDDERLIRHWAKLRSVRDNAVMVYELSQQHGGFGRFLASYPDTEIFQLWRLLAKQGSQLGGRSAPAFLRMIGRDTWMPSEDVATALRVRGIIDGKLGTLGNLKAAQAAINGWVLQSGRSMSTVSRIVSLCAD